MNEQIEILRRIAEQGLYEAQNDYDTNLIDMWEHMRTEIDVLKTMMERSRCA